MVPAYLLSHMRRIERKRKIVIMAMCCGSVLALLALGLVSILLYGPVAEAEGNVAILDCLTHIAVCFPSRFRIDHI